CYGIVSVPAGPWFCEKCLSQEKTGKVKCELCPMREGAVKHTDNGGWAHVVCALYIPEVRFGNVTTMDPIILSGVPSDRFSRICYICEERGLMEMKSEGACMQCNKLGCKAAFHVTWYIDDVFSFSFISHFFISSAQQEGLLCEESGQMDNIKYCGYCSHHFKKIKKDSNIKVVPPYKPVKLPKMTQNANNTESLNALIPSVAALNSNFAPSTNISYPNSVKNPTNVNNNSGSNAGSPNSINHSPKSNPNGSFSPTKDPPNRIISTKNPRSSPLNGGGPLKNQPKTLENHHSTSSPVSNHSSSHGTMSTSVASTLNDAHLINSIVSVASSSTGAAAVTMQRPLSSSTGFSSNVTPTVATSASATGAVIGHHSPSAPTAALTNGPMINPTAAIVPLTRSSKRVGICISLRYFPQRNYQNQCYTNNLTRNNPNFLQARQRTFLPTTYLSFWREAPEKFTGSNAEQEPCIDNWLMPGVLKVESLDRITDQIRHFSNSKQFNQPRGCIVKLAKYPHVELNYIFLAEELRDCNDC
uniref:PHD-type domain-containing protein n=1 Tax=Romanomermis culicivorax TaxID=13658 RepID=A0A915JQX3_ROMCU